jgi:phthiocerol/phenolphthiocerol synthesis type-I polyketide synthase D
LISTVGQTNGAVPRFDAEYWAINLRNPVRFSHAVAAAAENHAKFVEVSPHPLLTYAISDTLATTSSTGRVVVTSALKRVDDETVFFHAQLAAVGVMPPKTGRFVDIPSSPWLRSRYWAPDRSVTQASPATHPLLGVHVEMPSGRDHVWQADDAIERMLPWLAENRVQGQAVMSAAGFAEMALAAGGEALGLPAEAVRVDGLEVEQTLSLGDQTRLTTQLAHRDDATSVEIHASPAGGDWRRYAVATISVTDDGSATPEPSPEASASDTDIALPDEVADHPRYRIHPAMLHAALQALAAAIPPDSPDGAPEIPYLPVSFASMRVFGRVGRRARCRTELVDNEDGTGHVGRIVLMDDTGAPSAELSGVRLRRVDPRTVSMPLSQKVFDTQWMQESTVSHPGPSAASAGSWLLLAEDDPETEALAGEFAARFSSPSRRLIRGQLSDESAVRQRVGDLTADPMFPPAGVIVFVGERPFDGTDAAGALTRAQQLIWSLSGVARAADDLPKQSPSLWVVTRNGLTVTAVEPGDPAIAALTGVIRNWRFPGEAAHVLAGEPDIAATLVDVDSTEDAVAALVGELDSPTGDDVVAIREGRRYVERFSRAKPNPGATAVVRADGSYIVTGGLGGLGRVVVRWLLGRGAGRLILNGRTEPSDAARTDLADLAKSAQVVFVAGDIAAPGTAERLVAAAEETGLPLRGVIHAAGVTGDGIVAALTRDGMEQVWAPKVAGALRLHTATSNRQLDWWVGFSSMASLIGLPGQLAYTTANAWLDGLAAWRRASALPATAIGWGQWSDVGMSHSLTYSVLDPITPSEGIEALDALVGGDLTRVGVGRLRLDRAIAAIPEFRELRYFDSLVEEVDTSPAGSRSAADQWTGAAQVVEWSELTAEGRLSELAKRLQAILARELRMPASAVDMDQPFPELGLDSMMAMTVLRETQQLVGIDLSATMLWNHPTISSLAAYLAEMLAPQSLPEDDRDDDGFDPMSDSAGSVLDELFDSVESASAGRESGF